MLNITYRETDHPAAARAEHGDTIHEQIRDTLQSQQPPFFVAMIYETQQIQRPTFAYIYFDSVLHPIQSMLLVWSQLLFATHTQISANVLGCIHSSLTMSTFLF